MKKFIAASMLFMSVSMPLLRADNESEILMTVDGQPVSKSEFVYIYNKNNTENAVEHKTFDEYLDLFVNFKLKVADAKNQGLDTLPSFRNELDGYRTQLAAPYLTDSQLQEQLYQEAYSHFETDCNVSHILISLKGNTPADTLEAYNKALMVVERLKTEDFTAVAKEMSEDPSVSKNGGHLGYFTALQLVWPFEKAMYELPLNTVSAPVRTNYGYHVIVVHDRRPAWGQVKARHIMKMCSDEMSHEEQKTAYEQIKAIKLKLDHGEDFATLAIENSDDHGTSARGGELPWFGIGRMVPEFEKIAFSLKPDEISMPIKTKFGWHIIKVEERRLVEPYEKKKPEIKRLMQYDNRSSMARTSFVNKLKTEYNFTVDKDVYDKTVRFIQTFQGNDSVLRLEALSLQGKLATFANQTILASELPLFYLNKRISVNADAAEVFDALVGERMVKYENTQLEKKYPEFANLMNEYHDGILLFDISNREVWEKALADKDGISRFFSKNRKKYAWDEPRFKGFVFKCKNQEVAEQLRMALKSLPADSVAAYIDDNFNNDTVKNISYERGLWKMGDNCFVDKYSFNVENARLDVDAEYPAVFVDGKMLKKYPDSYTEVKGPVTADYQNYLEKQWLKRLKKQYKVVIDKKVLKTLK